MLVKKTVYAFRLKNGTEVDLDEYEVNQIRQELLAMDDWRVAACRGMLIDAIKRVRQITGSGLKEAKDAVEAFRRENENVAAFRYINEGKAEYAKRFPPIVPPPPALPPPPAVGVGKSSWNGCGDAECCGTDPSEGNDGEDIPF